MYGLLEEDLLEFGDESISDESCVLVGDDPIGSSAMDWLLIGLFDLFGVFPEWSDLIDCFCGVTGSGTDTLLLVLFFGVKYLVILCCFLLDELSPPRLVDMLRENETIFKNV